MPESVQLNHPGLYEEVLQSLEEPVRVLDADLRVVLANRSAGACASLPNDTRGLMCCSIPFSWREGRCDRCLVRATLEDGQPRRTEVSGIDANGDRWTTEIETKPLMSPEGEVTHVIEILRDRTRDKRLERQVLQSSKLVSIGELATGVAHEIRNPLAGIRLGLDALAPALNNSPEAREIVDALTSDIERLNRVVTDLLNFSRPQPHEPKWFDLRPLFDQACRFIRKGAEHRSIHFHIRVEPPNLRIWADQNQMHQVLLNILLNAVQAMPDGGELDLAGYWSENLNWSIDRERKRGYRIVIRDTGQGIPEAHIHRLYDPFFTTKPNGTGVGLTTSYSIIREHGGELRINSKPGEGTTAQILLPEGDLTSEPTSPDPRC
jgi:two-component system sensor histidine kinase HydH